MLITKTDSRARGRMYHNCGNMKVLSALRMNMIINSGVLKSRAATYLDRYQGQSALCLVWSSRMVRKFHTAFHLYSHHSLSTLHHWCNQMLRILSRQTYTHCCDCCSCTLQNNRYDMRMNTERHTQPGL